MISQRVKPANDRETYRLIFITALPIVLQNILESAVSSADVVMLNYVNQAALSAGSLATQYSSDFFMFIYGIGTGVTMLASQYWGKGDRTSVEAVRSMGLRYSVLLSALFAMLCLVIPVPMMKIFTSDPELIELGAQYLRIVAPGYVFWSATSVYSSILRSTGNVGMATAIESVPLFGNVILNAVFIFGLFGAPKLGLAGVALATLLSRILGFITALAAAGKANVGLSFRGIFRKYGDLHRDFITMSLPAIANDVSWGVGFSMYSVVLGHLGSDVVAANSIVSVVRNLSLVICYGIGSASLVILGNMLGDNRIEEAKSTSRTMLRLTAAAGVLSGITVFFLIKPVALFAQVTDTARDYLHFMMLVNTVYPMGAAINTLLIAGVFRAGGDSRFGFKCDTIDMWCYGVPLAFISAFLLKLPVKWVYLLMCTDEFVKWPWVFRRYYSFRWAQNITRD